MNETIFRKKSLERIASPDQLDAYLKVTNWSVWMVLAALVLALAAAGAWCFFGTMPTTANSVGLCTETGAVCFVTVEEGFSVQPGMKVRITPAGADRIADGRVDEVKEPILAEEAAGEAGAGWLTGSLPGDWVCPVIVRLEQGEVPSGVSCDAQIILDERRPIDLLLGR